MTVFIRGNTFVFPSLTVFYFNTRYGFQSCYNKQSVTIFPSVFKGAYPHSLVRILLLQRNGIAWYLEKAQPSYIKRRSLTGRKGVASQALFHPPIQLIISLFLFRLPDSFSRSFFLSDSGFCLFGKGIITFFDYHTLLGIYTNLLPFVILSQVPTGHKIPILVKQSLSILKRELGLRQ